jgi:hypothetical protein
MNRNNNVIKLVLTSLFFLLTISGLIAQNTPDTNNNQSVTIDDLLVRPIKLPALQEVGGSPFMTADYQVGSITIAENKIAANIPLKFNIYSNAIMIEKDGQGQKLESFELVSYSLTGNDGSAKQIVFKQGYPEIDNHNEKSVYQVLSMGPNVHLLKYFSQKVEDAPTLGDYSRREIVTTEQLYIYTPGGSIIRIKANKKSVVEALPSLSSKIEEVISANNLNLKNESAITDLIVALNKP